jgi:hypothetical protein
VSAPTAGELVRYSVALGGRGLIRGGGREAAWRMWMPLDTSTGLSSSRGPAGRSRGTRSQIVKIILRPRFGVVLRHSGTRSSPPPFGRLAPATPSSFATRHVGCRFPSLA